MKVIIKADALQAAVQKSGLSLAKFAQKCNLSAATIFRACQGKEISSLSYAKICLGLGYSIDDDVLFTE